MIKVLRVEDQKLVQEIISNCIEKIDGYEVAGILSNAADADMFCAGNDVQLIIMDVCTEYNESGLTAAAQIKKNYPNIKIIIVTSLVECSFLEKAKEAKADSFMYKNMGADGLIDIIKRTINGESVYPESTPEIEIGHTTSKCFTNAELRVLRYLVNGYSYSEIADKLGIQKTTVITHTNNMLNKTGFKNKLRLCIAVSDKKFVIPEADFDDE